jgi:hypothetical protein
MFLLRSVAIWFVIIAGETIHGILTTLLLVPLLGDFRARQVSVATGSLLIFVITYLVAGGKRLAVCARRKFSHLQLDRRSTCILHTARPAAGDILENGVPSATTGKGENASQCQKRSPACVGTIRRDLGALSAFCRW